MSRRKILFLVDHKHRDFPSLCLIGYYLKNIYEVFYRTPQKTDVDIINPEFIIVSRLTRNNEQIKEINQWREKKRKIIVIDAEGNQQSKTFVTKMTFKPDLCFLWSNVEFQRHKEKIMSENIKYFICGSPRLDFFHKDFQNFFDNNLHIKDKFKIKNEKKTITFAMNNSYEDISDAQKEKIKKRYYQTYKHNFGFEKKLEHMQDCRKTLLYYVNYVLENFKNVNIVIKPHPNEDVNFWNKIGEKNKNLKIMLGKSINELLKISDLHIGMQGCLTIVESSLLKVPSIELDTLSRLSKNEFFEEHLNLALYTASNVKEFHRQASIILSNNCSAEKLEYQEKKIHDYTEKYLYKFDGKRCIDYANNLKIFIEATPFDISLKENVSFQFNSMKKIFFNKIFDFKQNLIKVIKSTLFNKKVLDPRGRYDNRIKKGDENIWYEEFTKNSNIKKVH